VWLFLLMRTGDVYPGLLDEEAVAGEVIDIIGENDGVGDGVAVVLRAVKVADAVGRW